MKPRSTELKSLLRKHGYELLLAALLTLVGLGALVIAGLGTG